MENFNLYVDESGDLGFDMLKPGTSKYFVITLLCVKKDNDKFKGAVIRTLKNKINHRKNNSRIAKELKGAKIPIVLKKYFFKHLPVDGWEIYSVVLDKDKIPTTLKNVQGRKKLYIHMARFLLEKINFPREIKRLDIYIDKSTGNEEAKEFNHYIQSYLRENIAKKTILNIYHVKSEESFGIQAVDLFCWGIARKYSHLENAWYDIFKHRIRFEGIYLEKKATPLIPCS